MTECAICLSSIRLEEEAFLNLCFHRFHFKCITKWTSSQKAHPPDGKPVGTLTCPLCREGYTAIIHDCIDCSFRCTWVGPRDAQSAGGADVGSGLQLSAAQRRRRSRYMQPSQRQQDQGLRPPDPQGQGTSEQQGHQQADAVPARHPLKRPRLPRPVTDPIVATWLTRELQALMLERDVSLLVAVALGAIQQSTTRPDSTNTTTQQELPSNPARPVPSSSIRPRRTASLVPGHRSRSQVQGQSSDPKHTNTSAGGARGTTHSVLGAGQAHHSGGAAASSPLHNLTTTLAPFLGDAHAAQFAQELQGFIDSGLSIEAYDEWVFKPGLSDAGSAGEDEEVDRGPAPPVDVDRSLGSVDYPVHNSSDSDDGDDQELERDTDLTDFELVSREPC